MPTMRPSPFYGISEGFAGWTAPAFMTCSRFLALGRQRSRRSRLRLSSENAWSLGNSQPPLLNPRRLSPTTSVRASRESVEEIVIALFLNGQNQRLGEKDITEGTPTQATVYVRRILEEALHHSAAAIVLVHNHPSGTPEPSAGDDETTRDLLRACRLVGMVLLDHVIVGDPDHYSYADSGRLEELESE